MTLAHITEELNFCRVFRVPDSFTSKSCYGEGHECIFIMVDWFNPIPYGGDFEWRDGFLKLTSELREKHHEMMREFIREKNYYSRENTYVVITNYGDSLIIPPAITFL